MRPGSRYGPGQSIARGVAAEQRVRRSSHDADEVTTRITCVPLVRDRASSGARSAASRSCPERDHIDRLDGEGLPALRTDDRVLPKIIGRPIAPQPDGPGRVTGTGCGEPRGGLPARGLPGGHRLAELAELRSVHISKIIAEDGVSPADSRVDERGPEIHILSGLGVVIGVIPALGAACTLPALP